MNITQTRHRSSLLVVAAILGAVLAATGLVEDILPPLDKGIVATIDDEAIYAAQYHAWLRTIQEDRSRTLDDAERANLLERMIDERLLLLQAERSGLTRTQPSIRKAIVDAVVENIVSERIGLLPAEETLRAFYNENLAYFSQAPVLQIRRMVFLGDRATERASQAIESLHQGEDFAAVETKFADEDLLRLPSSPLPENRLSGYLGPTQTNAVKALAPGEFTEPMTSGRGLAILQLVDRVSGDTPPLDAIREQVQREWQRRGDEQALRDYLADLRGNSDIRRNTALLTTPTDIQ